MRILIMLAAASLLLGGCAVPKPIYQWEGYQTQVYEYFKGGSKEQQVTELESGLEKIRAQGGVVPPGYHAQLGMLYLNLGKDDQMVKEFQTEKTLFPESTPFMDFLMRNVNTDKRAEPKVEAKPVPTAAAATAATVGGAK